MAVKFFGQFLVEQGVVKADALLKAIELQDNNNLKLGQMALKMGIVTEADIERAHKTQMTRDIKLGDLLLEMGLLSMVQLNDVITHQRNTHLYIGEALVKIGALSPEQLQRQLDAFKTDQAEYVSNGIELPEGIANSAIWEMTADLTHKMITRVLDLKFRPGKCRVASSVTPGFMMAAMDFVGDLNARYIISVSAGLQKTIAMKILGEGNVDTEPAEVLEDTVMEFVNVVCGNVAAKASQSGVVMNIEPPLVIRCGESGIEVPEGRTGLVFPIHIEGDELMELVLLIKP